MNKIFINGVEMHDAEVSITTNEKPHTADDPAPPAGGGPGGEPPPPPPHDK